MRLPSLTTRRPRSARPHRLLVLVLAVLSVGCLGPGAWGAASVGPVPNPPTSTTTTATPDGVWPIEPQPEVVRRFDPPLSPYGAGHRGVDLLGAVGQPVRTALAGTVTFAGSLAGRGVVVVDHGDTRTTYQPLSPAVSAGAVVGRGAVIGTLQAGRSHCAPRSCLHWGWLRGTVYLDPLLLVGAGGVRLLPLGPLNGDLQVPPWRSPGLTWAAPLDRWTAPIAALSGISGR